MPSRNISRAQARAKYRQLEKLKRVGLYSGRLDKRKNPSKYQLKQLAKFRDVASGKAAVVKPAAPKSYAKLFRVVGDKVIVPRRKGEKITVTKKGAVASTRKVGRRKVTSYFRRIPHDGKLPPRRKGTMYFLPFIRGKDAAGRPILEWKRFPSKKVIQDYMAGSASVSDYRNWADYLVEEKIDATPAQLNKKLGKKRGRIRFEDDADGEDDE